LDIQILVRSSSQAHFLDKIADVIGPANAARPDRAANDDFVRYVGFAD
jgi:hypothetical protein